MTVLQHSEYQSVCIGTRELQTEPLVSLTVIVFFRPHHVYKCLDARFYDDEMLTVVLQGPEEENSRRILAQLPLASTLSCETEFIWEPNQRSV